MIDLERVDARIYDVITPVVEELTAKFGVDPDSTSWLAPGAAMYCTRLSDTRSQPERPRTPTSGSR